MIGQSVSHYRILEKVGGGGMGVVYKAEDTKLGRLVALKFLPEALSTDRASVERFQREARSASALNHPHICTIYDIDEHDGRQFIVMELLEGQTLKHHIAGQPLPTKQVLELGLQIADALEAAHAKGIIHRDLKPGNIIVSPRGQAKLLDFGLVRLLPAASEAIATDTLTETRAVIGTLPYMAPEQVRGEKVDAHADIYALGAVLYEMGTGQRPFPEELATRLTDDILHKPPAAPSRLNPELPAELERIILKCLEKDPEKRYHSASELMVDLRPLSAPTAVSAFRPDHFVLSRRSLLVGAGVVLAGLVAALVGFNLGGVRERLLRRPAVLRIESLAVLPLENFSRDPEQDYFAEGMTEALITDLAQISALKVISRTSVMRYKGTQKPLPEIARELNVDAVVEGSVQQVGNRVRITAQLVHARTDRHLWAQSYERDLRDILALQDEVARAIANEIQIKLTPLEQAHLARARPIDPEVYELYLKGRYSWNKRTEGELKKAIQYFEQAVRKDPNYAQAYSGLADSYIALNLRGYLSPKETNPRAELAIRKALETDDALAEAHASLARLHFSNWEWSAAEREFKRAMNLNPGYVEAHHAYSHYLTAMGRTAESLAESKRALELAPLDSTMNEHLGWHYLFARQYDQAIEQGRKTVELDANVPLAHYILGQAYEQRSMYEEAIAEFQKAISLSEANPEMLMGLGYAYAVAGKKGEGRRLLDKLAALSKQRYVSPFYMAVMYLGLGDKEGALRWLEKAYEERSAELAYLHVEPWFDPLRTDPRFQDLLRRMNFAK